MRPPPAGVEIRHAFALGELGGLVRIHHLGGHCDHDLGPMRTAYASLRVGSARADVIMMAPPPDRNTTMHHRWIALALWGFASAACAYTPPFNLEQVAPGVYVHLGKNVTFADRDHDDIANLGLVVGTKCAAVIDTGGSLTTGKAFRAAVRERTDKPICYVINTHEHPDHIFGNRAFQAKGTTFVGNSRLVDDMAQKRAGWIEAFAKDLGPDPAAAIIPPTELVPVGKPLTLDLGGRSLKLRAWPPAHTGSDLTAFEEKTRTLFTGDLLFRERIPALDGSLDGWLKAIALLEKRTPPAAVVVPGHGPVGHDLDQDIAPEQAYLTRLRKTTCAYIGAGGTLAQAPEKVMTTNKRHWLLWQQHQALNVSRTFLELQWTCF